jgi:hypothetical protein
MVNFRPLGHGDKELPISKILFFKCTHVRKTIYSVTIHLEQEILYQTNRRQGWAKLGCVCVIHLGILT